MQKRDLPRTLSMRFNKTAGVLLAACVTLTLLSVAAQAETPDVGAKAPAFTLSTPEGQPVHLSALTAKGPVVLIVLRGYPGYQCPYCQLQAHEFMAQADKFAAKGVELLLVYPGPPAEVSQRATEFMALLHGKLPANYHLVVDPEYKFTNQYGLRWDAPQETAYPSTFVIGPNGMIVSRKISREHGDRATVAEVLADLGKGK